MTTKLRLLFFSLSSCQRSKDSQQVYLILNYFALVAFLTLCSCELWITAAPIHHLFLSCCDWSPTSVLTFTFFKDPTDFSCRLMSCTVCYRAFGSGVGAPSALWDCYELLVNCGASCVEKKSPLINILSHLPCSLHALWLVKTWHNPDKTDSKLYSMQGEQKQVGDLFTR